MESSRGQIVLIAALGIAVTFVALAVIVNTVIFTENLATRETVQGDEPVAFERTVEESAETLLGLSNRDNRTPDDYPSHVSAYRYNIDTMSHGNSLVAASSGWVVSADLAHVHNGTWIIQDSDPDSFTDDQGNSTWTVGTDITDTRRFVLHVTDADSDPFVVTVSNTSTTWEMHVTDSGGYDVTTYLDGSQQETCSDSGSNVSIWVTNGQVNDTTCSTLDFRNAVEGPYNITFENASNVTGTYHLIVDRETEALRNDLPENNYNDTTEDPKLRTAIYNATVDMTFEQSELYYATNVTVEPEGPPGR